MPEAKPEPVIKVNFCDPCILTAEEFEKMAKDVWTRLVANVLEPGDKVLLQIIFEHTPRYCEVKEKKGEVLDQIVIGLSKQYQEIWSEREIRIREKRKNEREIRLKTKKG